MLTLFVHTLFGLTNAATVGLPGGLVGLLVGIIQTVLILAAVVALGFAVYGGFRYISARGEEGEIETAKGLITGSVIGLAAIGISLAIVNFTLGTVGCDPVLVPCLGVGSIQEILPAASLPGAIVFIIQTVLILAAVVALGFAVYGGFRYISARGEGGEIETAKRIIAGAVIGLVAIGISVAIINLVVGAVLQ